MTKVIYNLVILDHLKNYIVEQLIEYLFCKFLFSVFGPLEHVSKFS